MYRAAIAGLLILAAALSGYLYGHKQGENGLRVQWQADKIANAEAFEQAHLQAQARYASLQSELLAVEQAWLNTDPIIKTEYRNRVKTVTQYIENNRDYDVCRLNGERLRHVTEAIVYANDY